MDFPDLQQDPGDKLYQLLIQDHGLSRFLDAVAQLSAQHLSGEREVLCGIVLERAKRSVVVASSSAEAQQMDEVQTGFDEGPCLEAQRRGVIIRVPDTMHEKRWPRYMAAVCDSGLRSVLALPLKTDDSALVAINFYTAEIDAFSDQEVTLAQSYAELAAKAITLALRIIAHAEIAEDRRAAMESRASIDTAIGIIMAQNRCSQHEAFEILKQTSSNRNIKLRSVAEQLLASIGQGPATTPFDP